MSQSIKNRIIKNLEYLNIRNSSNLEEISGKLILTEIDLKKIHDEINFPLESLIIISNHYQISLDDLFKLDFAGLSTKDIKEVFRKSKPIEQDENFEIISIPFVSLAAAGSSLSGTEPKNFPNLQLPRRLFPSYTVSDYAAFEVEGNSMEPEVSHGSIIIGERIENHGDIRNGHRYVVILSDEIIFKRLFFGDKQSDTQIIKMVSDNKEHPEILIEASKIKKLWKPYQIIARSS
jgi:phage repressor protein C with HTH and peptisase S24 domain